MLLEIQIAVSFLTSYLYNKLPRRRVDLFSVELAKYLNDKFQGHWYPERSSKGSGYRCLLIGDELDPVLMNAAGDSGLSLDEIRTSLPDKLTMWIDPDEVSYRIEDQPVVKMIYQKDKYGEQENLAELESIASQQHVYATSPQSSNISELSQGFHHSPIQTSPIPQSHTSPVHNSPIQANYSFWSTQDTPPQTEVVHSRLSPNAQEFTYPVSKPSTTDYLYRQDASTLNTFASNLWGSPSNTESSIDRRQGLPSLHSLYGWLNMDSANYKRNYTPSQLEIMA